MELDIREGAVEDLKEMDRQVQEQVRDEIEDLRDNPLGEDTSLLNKQGLRIYRLKLKNDDLDHRVFFDLNNGDVVILGVMHRDDAYTPESIEKVKSRR
jgi:mRNA-degrading endonuclease RelE of RelBE toxin-antitoxin system